MYVAIASKNHATNICPSSLADRRLINNKKKLVD